VLSSAAKELEFSVHCMSASQAGYAARSSCAVNAIKHLAREEAWPQDADVDAGTAHSDGGEWNIVEILRRACLRAEGGRERA
jgi:hypothetical protein